ncbi:uncharacterized protein O3C94_014840 isoform 2-T2 [Discoglossus pictus]
MKVILRIICILSISLHAGYCLMCVECESDGESCTGPSKTCWSPSNICMSQYSETHTGKVRYFSRFCGSSRNCDQYRALSTPSWGQRSKSTCCATDSCTPTHPTLPAIKTNITGKRCPSCISWERHTCVTLSRVDCVDAETQCVTVNQTRAWTFAPKTNYMFTVRGCGTENLCNYGSSVYLSEKITHVDATCTN